MKTLKKLENIFAAVAFAEAGEFETAKEIAKSDAGDEPKGRKVRSTTKTDRRKRITPIPSNA